MGGGPRERGGQEPRLGRLGVRGEVRPSMTGAPDSLELVPWSPQTWLAKQQFKDKLRKNGSTAAAEIKPGAGPSEPRGWGGGGCWGWRATACGGVWHEVLPGKNKGDGSSLVVGQSGLEQNTS